MQISKCFLVLCVILCAAQVRGDNDAQIKAREALERTVNRARPEPPAAATAEPAPAKPTKTTTKPAPAPAAIPVSAPAPAAPTPIVVPAGSDSAAIEKARAAMQQKMQEVISANPSVAAKP